MANTKKSAAKRPSKRKQNAVQTESDSSYILKLVVYLIVGSFWLRLAAPLHLGPVVLSAFPVGLIVGLLLVSRDNLQIDRKIGYALVIVITVVSSFLQIGIIV